MVRLRDQTQQRCHQTAYIKVELEIIMKTPKFKNYTHFHQMICGISEEPKKFLKSFMNYIETIYF
jgi:hypothetical protein